METFDETASFASADGLTHVLALLQWFICGELIRLYAHRCSAPSWWNSKTLVPADAYAHVTLVPVDAPVTCFRCMELM